MKTPMTLKNRKLQHINIVLEENVEPLQSSFDKYRLAFKALPEIDFEEIDTSIDFLGKKLSFPFVISSMTGGEEKGLTINTNLAKAAERTGVALGLGSMRIILRNKEAKKTFDIRKHCPTIPLFANMGIVQLNYNHGADEINQLIDFIEGDGIFLHVNHLQEVIQPEGDTNFKNLIPKLEKILPKIHGEVIIKEVGHGIDFDTAKRLHEIGIKWIDVSGTGGTSWGWVEGYRRQDDLGNLFRAEGIPTDEALIAARKIENLQLIAGGGVRNGIHIAKAIALGADVATAAKPLLAPALESVDECVRVLEKMKKEFKIAMFNVGVKTVKELQESLLRDDS